MMADGVADLTVIGRNALFNALRKSWLGATYATVFNHLFWYYSAAGLNFAQV
jgi:hypothetical protein